MSVRAIHAAFHAVLGALALLGGCGGEAPGGGPLDLRIPPEFPTLRVPADNPTTVAGVALGRALFYDRRLSKDGDRACADCHAQAHSFSTPAVAAVLPHVNLGWSTSFLWDGGVEGTLEQAMTFEVEEFFEADVARLRAPDVEARFRAAFGTPEITTRRAAYALAQFERTLTSHESRFDRFTRGDTSALDEAERRGMSLFYSERGDCFHCHATALFTDNRFHNNGLEPYPAGTGRARRTGLPRDDGAWKTPTLRNIDRTAPYMHDDRFVSLEQVIEFYSEGIRYSPSVDTLITGVQSGGLHLTAGEKADLAAFLRALTDERYCTDPALAAP